MARKLRSNRLENRTNRLKLPVQGKPHDFTAIERGLAVGYRRNRTDGTWVARRSNDWTKAIGLADDYQEADGERVLTWFQAIDKARKLVHGDAKADKPPTVDDGLTDYEADLVATGGNPQNATSPRYHLPAALLAKPTR